MCVRSRATERVSTREIASAGIVGSPGLEKRESSLLLGARVDDLEKLDLLDIQPPTHVVVAGAGIIKL